MSPLQHAAIGQATQRKDNCSLGHSTLEVLFAECPTGRGRTAVFLEAGHVLYHLVSAFT